MSVKTTKCPACGAELLESFGACPYCGSQLCYMEADDDYKYKQWLKKVAVYMLIQTLLFVISWLFVMFGGRDIGRMIVFAAIGVLTAAPASLGSIYPLNEDKKQDPDKITPRLIMIFELYLGGAMAFVIATFISIGITSLFTI